jgi:hypothetical protein
VVISYDYLVLATGVYHSYFGHNDFEKFAPGLKTLADAVAIRNSILQAFEQAEAEEDLSRDRDLLTFVLVGAGPTRINGQSPPRPFRYFDKGSIPVVGRGFCRFADRQSRYERLSWHALRGPPSIWNSSLNRAFASAFFYSGFGLI